MIYKILLPVVLLVVSAGLSAQEVTNLVLVGPNGITQDPKEAISFVVVKQYPDSSFERLDYKMHGPMVKSRRYKDPALKILNGEYLEYNAAGSLVIEGEYANNQKTGTWNRFNDTGKHISSEKYRMDTLAETVDLSKKDSAFSYPDEKESEFPKGIKGWVNYLSGALEKSKVASTTDKGGTVVVEFIVDSEGKVSYQRIYRSVEYLLDNESLAIIKASPRWKPAFQNGKYVKSYKRQPITFNVQ